MTAPKCASVFLVAAAAAFGQPPAFQAADVHVSPYNRFPQLTGGTLRGSRLEMRFANMIDLVRTAYGVEPEDVIGGPSWVEFDRFDVIAKAPAGTPSANLRLMLQNLLAERFHLAVHKETRPMPAFVLTLGKGKPKLKESSGTGEPGCRPDMRPPAGDEIPPMALTCHSVSMESFLRDLRAFADDYLPDPVIDQTGLKGAWDLNIEWTPAALLARAGSDGVKLFDGVEKQLGLKLEAQKVARPVIVIDSANEQPIANPPNVTAALPPAPAAEFEVAALKESGPDSQVSGFGPKSGGRVEFGRVPLRVLLNISFDIQLPRRGEVQGAPAWFESARYDLVAKASSVVNPKSVTGEPFDQETYRAMMRKLIEDRLHFQYHFEDRPVTAFTLVADKPKLKPADPANRTGCRVTRGPLPLDPGAGPPPQQVTCRNMTMAQFADDLPRIAQVYMEHPALDSTGLQGAWDFSFSFALVPPNMAGGGGRKGGGAPAPPASRESGTAVDPSGVLSLFEAMDKQLGLKLEMHPRVFPVLVIDHIEQKPAGN
jgi:uncharacterized protein (TIGR03435 family)